MKEILKDTKVYLAGPMQYCDGQEWRNIATESLEKIGVKVLNPYLSPFLNAPSEDCNSHDEMRKKLEKGDFDSVAFHMKQVRRYDLACVDRADFLIVYIDTNVFTAGTMEELFLAISLKKPIFIFIKGGKKLCPFWILGCLPHHYIYNELSDVLSMIDCIHLGEIEIDSERWRLLKPDLR